MKNSLKKSLLLFLILSMTCLFAACSSNDKEEPEAEDLEPSDQVEQEIADDLDEKLSGEADIENPLYDNEQEGAEVEEKAADKDAFIGKWEATSQKAAYYYGTLNFDIRKDGTWKGTVVDEEFSGTWEYNGTGITLSSELVNCDLFFASDGNLMFCDHDVPDDYYVLTKVK